MLKRSKNKQIAQAIHNHYNRGGNMQQATATKRKCNRLQLKVASPLGLGILCTEGGFITNLLPIAPAPNVTLFKLTLCCAVVAFQLLPVATMQPSSTTIVMKFNMNHYKRILGWNPTSTHLSLFTTVI